MSNIPKVVCGALCFFLGIILAPVLAEHPVLWVIVPFLVGAAVVVANEL